MSNDNLPEQKKPTVLQMVGSVLSAIFGVQNNKNRERDFTQGNIKAFIVVYAVIVIMVIIGMIALVKFVIAHAMAG